MIIILGQIRTWFYLVCALPILTVSWLHTKGFLSCDVGLKNPRPILLRSCVMRLRDATQDYSVGLLNSRCSLGSNSGNLTQKFWLESFFPLHFRHTRVTDKYKTCCHSAPKVYALLGQMLKVPRVNPWVYIYRYLFFLLQNKHWAYICRSYFLRP